MAVWVCVSPLPRGSDAGLEGAPWVQVSVADRSCMDLCHWWLQVTSCEVGVRLEAGRDGAGTR